MLTLSTLLNYQYIKVEWLNTNFWACVRAWVTQFSLKLLQLHIFGKLVVLMNFYALQNFRGFGELWPTFE